VLENKYYLDELYRSLCRGSPLGTFLWKVGDMLLIDGLVVNGRPSWWVFSSVVRKLQTGFIYHYAFDHDHRRAGLMTLWFCRSPALRPRP
jgi:NADH-quinone oxidoreductase subunit L